MMIEGYKCGEVLYQNSISKTYRAVELENNQKYIIKILNTRYLNSEESIYFVHDYETARRINYPDGVMFPLKMITSDQAMLIIYEDFSAEPLSALIAGNSRLSLIERFEISIRLTSTLDKIHSSKITHKSISPQNVLYNRDTKQLCIIDCFIASSRQHPVAFQPTECLDGAIAYISPEQTSRFNKDVDYRSDFYSLGVTLYELFTGHCLYKEGSSLGFVQAHLNKSPPMPREFNKDVPLSLSNLIMKLMNKHPQDRYYSAQGILWDLNRCFEYVKEQEANATKNQGRSDFLLGEKDFLRQLHISNNLYGRDQEVCLLFDEFSLVCQGRRRCLLVTGSAGVGKTSIVKELFMPLTLKGGMFISGKFDQFHRIPYSAFLQALEKAIHQILLSSPQKKSYWSNKVSAVLGKQGRLITDVLPCLEQLIGPQPVVKTVNVEATKERFTFLLKRLFSCLSSSEHPLILFIDDLQWLDFESLRLFSALLEDSTLQYFFIIGAYRDDELEQSVSLKNTIDESLKNQSGVSVLPLRPLSFKDIKKIVHDTLVPSIEPIDTLCRIILDKTSGSPWLVKEFLKIIYEEKAIAYDVETHSWVWNIADIEKIISINLSSILAKKLSCLPYTALKAIHAAACLGYDFSLDDLSLVLGKPSCSLIDDLNSLSQQNLILPLDNTYRLSYSKFYHQISSGSFKHEFSHDIIQYTIYQLNQQSNNQHLHFSIAETLFAKNQKNISNLTLFKVVEHYQIALDFVSKHENRDKILHIFIDAGERALTAGAYTTAEAYLKSAKLLQREHVWSENYATTLKLYNLLSTVELCLNNFHDVFRYTKEIVAHTFTLDDAFTAHINNAKALNANNQLGEAQEYLSNHLLSYGIHIPVRAASQKINLRIMWTNFYIYLLNKKSVESLPLVKQNSEEDKIRQLIDLYGWFATRENNTNTMMLCYCERIQRVFKHGIDINCALSFQGLANCYIASFWDIKRARQLSLFTESIPEILKDETPLFNYSMLKNFTIQPWVGHLNETLEPLKTEYIDCKSRGETILAADYLGCYTIHHLILGRHLASVIKDVENYLPEIKSYKTINTQTLAMIGQVSEELKFSSHLKSSLNGRFFSEEKSLLELKSRPPVYQLFLTLKIKLAYLYSDFKQAEKIIAILETEMLSDFTPLAFMAWLLLYRSLTHLALFDETLQSEYLKLANQDIRIIKKIARHCPQNYELMLSLVKAQKLVVTHKLSTAEEAFLEAIDVEKRYPNIIMRALMHKLMVALYVKAGKREKIKTHLRTALSDFSIWGADGYAKHLEDKYVNYRR